MPLILLGKQKVDLYVFQARQGLIDPVKEKGLG